MDDDIIRDVLRRVEVAVSRGEYTAETSRVIEQEVRRDWGGDEVYIGIRARREERDRQIVEAFRRGEHVPLLARRHKLTQRRVWQILRARNE